MDPFKIITLNVNGIRLPSKRRALFTSLRKTKADFILLQETHSTHNDEVVWRAEWGGEIIFSHGRSNSKGVAILIKRSISLDITHLYLDTDGRYIIMQMPWGDEPITLINVYAPTSNDHSGQSALLNNLYTVLNNMEVHNIIIGGDFNTQLDMLQSANEGFSRELDVLLEEYNLVDIWRRKNPTNTRGTFHRNSYSSRLDYLFAPEFLLPSISSVTILPEPLSDHSRVAMVVNAQKITRGPGFWHFDNTLLNDQDFVQEMRQHIEDALQEDFDNPNSSWEWTKYKIREFCIAYKIAKNREQRALTSSLEKRLELLAVRHDLSDSSDVVQEVNSIKRELSEIRQHLANKAIFKAKAQWTQLGEKPSAYFLGLQKRQSKDKSITMLKDETGQLLTDPKDILAYEKRYFEDIYSEDITKLDPIQDFPLTREDLPQVTDSHRMVNNLPFTPRDFFTALKQLNKGKSPGSDGITPEFYLAFWDLMENPFYESIMFSLEQGSLSQEQRTGIITLIPKKSQDRLSLNNWRPITLLNTDFKIFSKALATRLQSCVHDVVQPDQTGFIKGRTIGSNLSNIQMVIDHTNLTGSDGFLLAVDYRKAFDTIRWDLIHYAMEVFGFGELISSAVKILFKDIKTCTVNSGNSSEYFFPSRGIRQGCCSSPTIFVIAVELLAIMVRRSLDIRGIDVFDHQVTISQYADDATFFLRDLPSLDALLLLLAAFASMSGLHFNKHKSYLLLLGHHLDPPTQYHGIQIQDRVTILGITFANRMTEEQHYTHNFEQKLNRIRGICSSWMNRNLSMKGKVLLISALMTSILQYPCSNTTTPPRVLSEYKKITTEFFWNYKRGKVAYALLTQDISDGGIKLPHLPTRIEVSHLYWIRFMWERPESTMALLLKHLLGFKEIRQAIESTVDLSSRIPSGHTFLKAIMKTWYKYHLSEPRAEEDVQRQPIWNNRHVLIQQQPVVWPQWRNAGIYHVNDLIHDTHPRFFSHIELGEKYGISVSFLKLLQIRMALPCRWKRLIQSPANPQLQNKPYITTTEGDPMAVTAKSSKDIYRLLIKYSLPAITSQARWNDVFPVDTTNMKEYWATIYKAPYKSVRDTKLQAFSFRIVHRFLPCKRYLKNIRIRADDICSFCPSVDTIDHFLFECPIVQTFWKEIVEWFDREADIQLSVSLRAFLFGVPNTVPQAKIINFVLLFTKFFVYRQKLFHQGSLCLLHFLKELRLRLQVEKYLNTIEDKRHLFGKWQRIYTALG